MNNLTPFLSRDEIAVLVSNLGRQISEHYESRLSDSSPLWAVVVLKGALFFAADLARAITVPLKLDFVRLTSYGNQKKSSGTVRLLKDIEHSPQGNHILIIDEIVDSGHTLAFLRDRIQSQSPQSLEICCLLDKPSRREVDIGVRFCGRVVQDEFLVGYGLDHNELLRNVPDIRILKDAS